MTQSGASITIDNQLRLNVPDNPIIPFIEGDGTGPDIWRASVRVFDAAVEKAYVGKRKLIWQEVLAGQKAFDKSQNWLPDETVEAFGKYLVGIKGPLTTPVGGGIRSLNVALQHKRRSVTFVHKGNIQKFTEGAFRDWGYKVAKQFYGATELDGGPWCTIKGKGKNGEDLIIKDAIADITLQQVLTRPEDFDVVATPNLNGDYLSDALAAQVGGIGIAPGANINYVTGHAVFEATHSTAPKYANQDKVNPGSVILSGVMMLEHLEWLDAARDIVSALERTIADKIVTYDFARLMEGATEVKCSEFAQAIVERL